VAKIQAIRDDPTNYKLMRVIGVWIDARSKIAGELAAHLPNVVCQVIMTLLAKQASWPRCWEAVPQCRVMTNLLRYSE
jgi:hypothetical protein